MNRRPALTMLCIPMGGVYSATPGTVAGTF
jgi:hypothetical protein